MTKWLDLRIESNQKFENTIEDLGIELNQKFENTVVVVNLERIPANAIHLADDIKRAIKAFAYPVVEEVNSCIIKPEMQATIFELKPVMFQMLQTTG